MQGSQAPHLIHAIVRVAAPRPRTAMRKGVVLNPHIVIRGLWAARIEISGLLFFRPLAPNTTYETVLVPHFNVGIAGKNRSRFLHGSSFVVYPAWPALCHASRLQRPDRDRMFRLLRKTYSLINAGTNNKRCFTAAVPRLRDFPWPDERSVLELPRSFGCL